MSIRTSRDFVRIWSGQAVSNVGDGVHRIAILWWARQSTGSNLAVVAVALATTIPGIVAAPFAGWLVDRMDRRHLMLWSDLARVGTSGAIAVLAWSGALEVWSVMVLAAFAAVAGAVFNPAYMASITMLVPPDDRPTANSMVGLNDAIAGILGPAIGGLLVGLWGVGAALWFDAATFVVSMLFVLASVVPMPARSPSADADGEQGEGFLAGLALLRRDRSLRDLTLVAVGLNTFVAPVPVIIVALAAGPFALGGTGYGLLEAAIPLGLLAGFAFAPRVATRRLAGMVGLLVSGGAIALVGAAPWALAAGASLVAAGVGVGVVNTVLPTRFQADVEPAVQGRVFALLGGLMQVGRPVGLAMAAPLIAVLGPRGGITVCGVAMLLVTLAGRRGVLGPEVSTQPAAAAAAAPSPA